MTAARGFASFVFTVQLALTVIPLFGTNLALGGEIEAAELVALLVLSVRYVEPLVGAADVEGALRIARNSLSRMDVLMATPPLPESEAPRCPAGANIVFEDAHPLRLRLWARLRYCASGAAAPAWRQPLCYLFPIEPKAHCGSA